MSQFPPPSDSLWGQPPSHNNAPRGTSRTGAKRIASAAPTLRAQVLAYIASRGDFGATDEEGELATERLIAQYTVDDEPYINIVGFQHKQPAGKNGKRIRKCPDPSGVSGESSAIQIDPGESSASLEIRASHSHSHSHSQHQQHHQNHQDADVRDADADGSLREWAADKAKRPEWLPQGKGWPRAGVWLATAHACPTVTREQFDDIIREAKASRNTLANPAGFVLARLKALAKGPQ